MGSFRKLDVWQLSHKLTLYIYKVTKDFPNDEKFALTSQMRRAASSIPTNIAEGCGQLTESNYIRYLGIAKGSAMEVDYLLLLAKDLGYIDKEKYTYLYETNKRIIQMLYKFISKLKNK